MRTCREIHAPSKVNIGFICCGDAFTRFKAQHLSLEALLKSIDQNTEYPSAVFDAFDLFGVKRVNQFEGYGRATESNEIPYHAYITKEYSGDRDYHSGDRRTFNEALEWLAFHLERLHNAQTDLVSQPISSTTKEDVDSKISSETPPHA